MIILSKSSIIVLFYQTRLDTRNFIVGDGISSIITDKMIEKVGFTTVG
jgi:hypothetical protein